MNENEKVVVKNNWIISTLVSELVIDKGMEMTDCIATLQFPSMFTRLRRIDISSACLKEVHEFVVDGFASLESVKIGEHCFRKEWKEELDDGICQITNCPNLRQLEIGSWNFRNFHTFKLSNLDALQSIKIGDYCFQYASPFSLIGKCFPWK